MLLNQLRPDQKTIIVPGGGGMVPYYEWELQDPKQFVYFAEEHPEVAIVMPFIWFNTSEPGIHTNGMEPQYRNAGLSVVYAKNYIEP